MWHVALESWHWIHQVAAPCNVIRGSGMTWHWIRPLAAPCDVTHSSGIMTVNSPGGSTLQCSRWLWNDMPLNLPKPSQTSGILEFYIWFHFRAHHLSRYVNLHQSPKFYLNHPRLRKMTSCRFSRWRISAIFNFKDPIKAKLQLPRSSLDTIALNCLVFEKIAFFHFGVRQINRQTNRWTAPMH